MRSTVRTGRKCVPDADRKQAAIVAISHARLSAAELSAHVRQHRDIELEHRPATPSGVKTTTVRHSSGSSWDRPDVQPMTELCRRP